MFYALLKDTGVLPGFRVGGAGTRTR